jgi:hypothetical protein
MLHTNELPSLTVSHCYSFCEKTVVPPSSNLPTPDFTFDPNAQGACIAGVRPYRNCSYRLDAETISGKFIVHNYGHGGAGITLSWRRPGLVDSGPSRSSNLKGRSRSSAISSGPPT